MSIDTIMKELHANNWLVNDCYQSDINKWRVALRRPGNGKGQISVNWPGDWFSEFGYGTTLLEALEDCMHNLADAEYIEWQAAQTHTLTGIIQTTYQTDVGKSLLLSLGLIKPAEAIKRRV